MSPPPVSRAVRIGHVLATLLLVMSVVFGAAALVSARPSAWRATATRRSTASRSRSRHRSHPTTCGACHPACIRAVGPASTSRPSPHPTTGAMLLRTALDLAPLPLIVAAGGSYAAS